MEWAACFSQKTFNDRAWQANWQREIEGVYLYRQLAEMARTPAIRQALTQMADAEQEHARLWAERVQASQAGRLRFQRRVDSQLWTGDGYGGR